MAKCKHRTGEHDICLHCGEPLYTVHHSVIAEKDKRIKQLEDALKQIRDNEGKVCELYEICECVSCSSSYNSWAIASQALEVLQEDSHE